MYKYILFILISIFVLFSCAQKDESQFTDAVFNEELDTIEGEKIKFKEILAQHKGKKIILEFWASWCADCIKSMPKVAKFQEEHPEVQFILISVDDEESKWKNGLTRYIDKFQIQGDQYHIPTGWDKTGESALIEFVGLDWIPRYMLVNEDGKIQVYYAKSITDKNITNHL